jgi:S1/P1 Nuclease
MTKFRRLPWPLVIVSILFVRIDPARAWGDAGHEIVAYIAADNLSPTTRRSLAKILQTPDEKRTIAQAMATIAILPDTQFRKQDPSSSTWHFINLCLQDRMDSVRIRCDGNCVVAKINEYAARLRSGDYDRWGAQGDLAFLIHLIGDIYQPLHAANNADQGGNCIQVNSPLPVRNLHILWDVVMVTTLENNLDSGSPRTTAHVLEGKFARYRNEVVWNSNTAAELAFRSKQLAITQIYEPLNIPLETCVPEVQKCRPGQKPVTVTKGYIDRESRIAGEQLAKAGFALANLLRTIWR